LRGRIGRRHELWCHIARRTECRIVKGRQILPRGAARGLSKAYLLPFGARDRALLVGISDNQARINRKALTADQAGCNAGFNDTLENPAEHQESIEQARSALEQSLNAATERAYAIADRLPAEVSTNGIIAD
jgi:hypothetical protein